MRENPIGCVQGALVAVGISLIAIGLCADWLAVGNPGVGSSQVAMVIVGLGMLGISCVLQVKSVRMYVTTHTPVVKIAGESISFLQRCPIGVYWLSISVFITSLVLWYGFYASSMLMMLVLAILCASIAGYAGCLVLRSPYLRRRFLFSHVLTFLMLASFGIGVEVISGSMVPGWPARELRPVRVTDAWARIAGGGFNSWGLRDIERAIQKPPGIKRIVFLGDSMLEASFSRKAHPGYVCDASAQRGMNSVECFNLGVSTTGPRQYLYRMRNIGMSLSPDAVLLFVYPGNDLVKVAYENQPIELIDERPLPSILGVFMPRLTWLLVNRLRISEFGRSNKAIPNEFEDLQRIGEMPYEKGIVELSHYMHRYYFTEIARERIEEILRRGGASMWQEIGPREVDREYLLGWRIKQVVRDSYYSRPKVTLAIPESGVIGATASYIEEIAEDLEERHIPLIVFLVPVAANVDPEYRKFWEPWYHGDRDPFNRVNREALFKALGNDGIKVVDLTETLNGIPGTYRKLDGHWTEKGHVIVAEHIAETIIATLPPSRASASVH